MTSADLEALALAGALDGLSEGAASGRRQPAPRSQRREALWAAGIAARRRPGMLPDDVMSGWDASANQPPPLPGMSEIELTLMDIAATGISPDRHPGEFSRPELRRLGVLTATQLYAVPAGTRVHVAGVVTHRQRPPTAAGVTFLNIEDETGMVNVICQAGMWGRYRRVARAARALVIRGIVERDRGSLSLVADRMAAIDIDGALPSRDYR